MRSTLCVAMIGLLLSSTIADAAPRKGKRPAKRRPTVTAVKPAAPKPPTTPGIMIPRPVVLTGTTRTEARAHLVWSLRAALNVAALQCQYSPFLRTVDNYNQMLRKHGDELTSAQTTMIGFFTRTQKRGGMAGFDRYNTRSYNSFSTLDAQYNFCWTAAQAGLAVRMADVGRLGEVAEAVMPGIRASLSFVPAAAGLTAPPLPPFPDFSAPRIIADD